MRVLQFKQIHTCKIIVFQVLAYRAEAQVRTHLAHSEAEIVPLPVTPTRQACALRKKTAHRVARLRVVSVLLVEALEVVDLEASIAAKAVVEEGVLLAVASADSRKCQ